MVSEGKKEEQVSGKHFLHELFPPVGTTKMEIVKKTNYADDLNTRGGYSRVVMRMNWLVERWGRIDGLAGKCTPTKTYERPVEAIALVFI